MLLLVLFFSFS